MKILQPDRVTDFAFGKHRVKRDVIEVQLFHVGTTLKKEGTDNKFNLYVRRLNVRFNARKLIYFV